ncbi:glyoxalase superfamily protein [Hymenobacter sp. 5317J-9]|uniref:glyoxalase superfamily protein n=1 Tax=Hymenobacter sp. 5317J-9 TaxID=2932250 RepID=UPI001FD6970C|nr:glyoxalase superfamily protein [Hymenobacter sp. 5317J-9]UOQ98788.1 glyoxalase superfamily protein [Hymenobacter sp. 5317J-9]
MLTPVFRILDYAAALEFYVGWLGFRVDWEQQPVKPYDYAQVSRGDVVIHLSTNPDDSCPGARVRALTWGLLAYHNQLLDRNQAYTPPTLNPATWSERVMEMEVLDPFGNRIVFCEAPGLRAI